MTDEKRTCPYCKTQLEPDYAEMLRDLYESRTILIDVYKTAFEGAAAAVHKEDYEYNRLLKRLREKVQQYNTIVEKYTPIIEEIRSKIA
jgi:hypothetical protein